MEQITGDMKVAEVIQRCPAAVDVFLARGCPDMRRGFFNVMARFMSVRNAARIHKLELGPLLDDLNKVARSVASRQQTEEVNDARGHENPSHCDRRLARLTRRD